MRLEHRREASDVTTILLVDHKVVPEGAAVNLGSTVDEEEQYGLQIVLQSSEILAAIVLALAFCDAHLMQVELLIDFRNLLTKVLHFLFNL